MVDVFKKHQRKANSSGIARFFDEPGYAQSLIKAAQNSKGRALAKKMHKRAKHFA